MKQSIYDHSAAALLLTTTLTAWAQPIVTRHPTNLSVSLGATASFRVYATSTNPPITYQWRHGDVDLTGATAANLSLTNVQITNAGIYRVAVSDTSGTVLSNPALLTVDPTFTKITTGRIVTDLPGSGYFCGAGWADYDGDGWEDLLISSRPTLCVLYRNKGDGTFDRITSGVITRLTGSGRGVIWGDYDNDGFPDLFIGKTGGQSDVLLRNNGDGTFSNLTASVVARDNGSANGCAWIDYDQDGYLDLFVANADQRPFLYHNNRAGDFMWRG